MEEVRILMMLLAVLAVVALVFMMVLSTENSVKAYDRFTFHDETHDPWEESTWETWKENHYSLESTNEHEHDSFVLSFQETE